MTTVAGAERFRVGPPSPSGMRLVTDRIRSESFWVYPPVSPRQQFAGHESGRWYFRPLGNEASAPVSLSYPSFEAAMQGLALTQTFKDLTSEQASTTPRPH